MTDIDKTRANIAKFGRMLFDRQLTDAAGGNISVRVGDKVCITPRFTGQKKQWQIEGQDVLVVNLSDGVIIEGDGQISRESQTHLKLHRDFGEHGVCVIHAHPRNVLVFACVGKPLPPVLEATQKFGTLPVVAYAPAHSAQLGENIANAVRGNEARIRKHAMGVIAPWHGLFVMAKDLDAGFDAVERMDNNAYVYLMGQHLGMNDSHREALERETAQWEHA
jgi:L-fuculose-phosphate aldolase